MQYVDLNGDYRNLLAVLLTLANNCELQPFVLDSSLPHQAAEYRQQLFVEMINEGEPVPRKCAVCNKKMNPHKPSALPEVPKAKVMVSMCSLPSSSSGQLLNNLVLRPTGDSLKAS